MILIRVGSTADFIWRLCRAIPEIDALRIDHIQAFGELLPHVLFGEITQWAQDEAERGTNSQPLRHFLAMIEAEWLDAASDVENLLQCRFSKT